VHLALASKDFHHELHESICYLKAHAIAILFISRIKQTFSLLKKTYGLQVTSGRSAVAESFFKTIKYEWLYRFKLKLYNQLLESIEDYINWYNIKRLHSSLGYLSPL
jgi:transposase InsO family protein